MEASSCQLDTFWDIFVFASLHTEFGKFKSKLCASRHLTKTVKKISIIFNTNFHHLKNFASWMIAIIQFQTVDWILTHNILFYCCRINFFFAFSSDRKFKIKSVPRKIKLPGLIATSSSMQIETCRCHISLASYPAKCTNTVHLYTSQCRESQRFSFT